MEGTPCVSLNFPQNRLCATRKEVIDQLIKTGHGDKARSRHVEFVSICR